MYCTVLCLALLPFFFSFSVGPNVSVPTCNSTDGCAIYVNVAGIGITGQTLLCLLPPKCCPDDECYDLCPPWTTPTRPVPPPTCVENPVKYLLSNRSNPTYPVVFTPANFSQIQDYYDVSKPTVIVIHGYLESEDSPDIRNITGVYLTKVDANAIFVDYGNITYDINYFQSVSDLRVAARYVTKAVKTLIGLGTSPSAIHLIGFSLGAHFAAYIAKAIPGIGRLTGLDPAGPGFTDESCVVRLCQGDAIFTEAIHTDGHPVIGFGTPNEDADVDLWVNGGWDQPNCGITLNPMFFVSFLLNLNFTADYPELPCSHERAVFIYAEALASTCTIWGVQPVEPYLNTSQLALGYPTKYIVNTQGCTLADCVPIGLETINATGRGNFIVPTNWDSPFCVSQFPSVSAVLPLPNVPVVSQIPDTLFI